VGRDGTSWDEHRGRGGVGEKDRVIAVIGSSGDRKERSYHWL